jgi:hypothetical protein
MWKWKPAPDQWSIHEVIAHLADSEANGYARCREEGATRGELLEVLNIGLVVGGSITIPHLRRAFGRLREIESRQS